MKTNPCACRPLLQKLVLSRLGEQDEAGLALCSLPLPREPLPSLSLGGRPTWRQEIGQWPEAGRPLPRRALLAADLEGPAPAEIPLRKTAKRGKPSSSPPTAELILFEKSAEPNFVWERHAVRIRWGSQTVDFLMGMRVRGEVHWWEACHLVVREESPLCRIVEVGGAIPHTQTGFKELECFPGYTNPFLHRHNWLNGQIYLRLHANGVCEVFARHINSRFFDDGLLLSDAVPVVGLRLPDHPDRLSPWEGAWRGEEPLRAAGEIRFDLSDVAPLATADKPGAFRLDRSTGVLIWQPYLGMELYGGVCPKSKTGDPWIFKAEQQIIPRGMGRTLRFSFSLNPLRSPRIARYQAPNWWYGVCEELTTAPLLPVFNVYDADLKRSMEWVLAAQVRGGFEDGSIPRGARLDQPGPYEPGWEGEVGYAVFLQAWRTGSGALHDAALRNAYYFADVVVDHAAFQVRMHGYPSPAISVPMQRIHTLVAGHLETGDPYLLQTARAVMDNAFWIHKNSWPRMCVGRDACFIRGLMMLYRYWGERTDLARARDAGHDVWSTQRPNGSFGDQGGGSGIHAWGAYITKPWMGFMAVGGLLDYLELAPKQEPRFVETIRRFADWLMRERYDHDGVMGWGYQHDYNGGRRMYNPVSAHWSELPGRELWHQNYIARFMTFCALRFNNAAYFDAWAESEAASLRNREERPSLSGGDHSTAQNGQYLPWVQARLWNARLTPAGRVVCEPVYAGPRTPDEATLPTPVGPLRLRWKDGRPTAEGRAPVRFLRIRRLPFPASPEGGAPL